MTSSNRFTRAAVLAVACIAFSLLLMRSPWASGSHRSLDGAAPLASVSGIVRSAEGRPIAAATVCATCTTCARAGDAPLACAASDTSGRYTIGELPAGRYTLAAAAEGYVAGVASPSGELLAADRQSRDVSIALASGGARVAGTVRSAAGTPIGRARVRIARLEPPRFVLELTTDVQGRFGLAMPSGPFELNARADAYAPAIHHGVAPAQRTELVLERAVALRGKVVRARGGEPVAGVVVRAVPRDRMPRVASAESSSDGAFALNDLAAGSYLVSASGAGTYGELPSAVELAGNGGEPIALEVHPAHALEGQVVLRDGTPCAEGYVLLGEPNPAQPSVPGERQAEVSTQPIGPDQYAIIEHDGTVRFGGVPPARYFASIHCDGFVLDSGPTVLELPRDAERELRWTVSPAPRLSVRVLDARGRPASRARIAIAWPGRDGRRVLLPAQADEDGRAQIAGPRCGECQALAADNVGAARAVPFEISADGASGRATLTLEGDAALELEVRDHDGAPIDGLLVIARNAADASRRYVAVALGDGRYRIAALPAGPYVVTGDDRQSPAAVLVGTEAMPIEIAAGAQLRWQSVLSRSGALSGRVVDAAGQPVSDAWVSAQRAAAPSNDFGTSLISAPARRVATDREGRFVIDRLAPSAQFQLRAEARDGSAAVLDARTPASGIALTLLEPPVPLSD